MSISMWKCLKVGDEHVMNNLYYNRVEVIARARAVDAMASVDLEQGAVGRALDEGHVSIQKLILQPFQVDPGMRAAVEEGMKGSFLVYNKNINNFTIKVELEGFAARIWKF